MTGSLRFFPHVYWLASLGAVVALGLAFFFVRDEGPIVCVFRLAAGLPCPGCGLTRSLAHLLRGELSRSIAAHPFGVLLAIEGTLIWAIAGLRLHRGLPVGLPRDADRWALAHAIALLAFWTGRLASGTAPF